MSKVSKVPKEFENIDISSALIAKENLLIKKELNKHFEMFGEEVYVIGFGKGEENKDNPKGLYVYWVWYKGTPYAGLMNCTLKDKYDAIDYYNVTKQNAEDTITEVLKNEKKD